MKRALLFGGLPMIAGIALIVVWSMAEKTASRGNDWTQVLATIETAEVQGDAMRVAYRYDFAGQTHRNAAGRITLRGTSANRYAPGTQILAYVNGAAPAESFLEPPPPPSTTPLVAGAVLVLIGIPIAVYFLRTGKPTRGRPRRPTSSRPMSRLKPPPSALRK